MKTDNFKTGTEAQEALMRGIDKTVDAIKGTYGAAGYNYLAEHDLPPFAISSNDGVSLARAIELADPYERMGANLVKEIATRAEKQTGDGTTGASILLQATIKEGMKAKGQPMEIVRSLNECLPVIEKSIKDQTIEIVSKDGQIDYDWLKKVVTVSAEDPTIADTIANIYYEIGKDGLIFRDVSKTGEDYFTVSKGIRIIDSGMASPYMADTDNEGRQTNMASYINPAILITKQKINSAKDIELLCQTLDGNGKKELVIFAQDYEGIVVTELVMTRLARGFKALLVKMPVLWRDEWLTDLSLLTGAKVVDPALGLALKDVRTTDLGTCGQIIATKSTEKEPGEVFLDGLLDVSEHVKTLAASDRDEDLIRAARLNTKTARYFVGAPSDQALSYRRLKVDDAVGTAHEALQHGIVPGGGVALFNTSLELGDTVGSKILREALKAPIKQICINAGQTWQSLDIPDSLGFDAKTGSVVDMLDAGIVDSASVVLSSIRNALSVAAIVLSARVLVTLPPQEMGMPNRMPIL